MSKSRGKGRFDYLVKLLLIGDSGVGKSCLLLRYCDGNFTTSFISTIGIDFKIKTIKCGDKTLKLQIWDTAGQERFRTICTAYYRGAQGIFLAYSLDNRMSFNNVQNWMAQITQHAAEDVRKVLLANKADLPIENQQVGRDEGRNVADKYGIKFFETSAKTGDGVGEAFAEMGRQVLEVLERQSGEGGTELPAGYGINTKREQPQIQLGSSSPNETSNRFSKNCCSI